MYAVIHDEMLNSLSHLDAVTKSKVVLAYVEYQIARFAYPSNYGDVMGYPARSSGGKLRNFQNGYGEFYVSANFDIHGATYEEKAEIVSLLESGVFV